MLQARSITYIECNKSHHKNRLFVIKEKIAALINTNVEKSTLSLPALIFTQLTIAFSMVASLFIVTLAVVGTVYTLLSLL